MTGELTGKQRFQRIVFFFPLQLVLVLLKKNHILLFFWVCLFGYITGFLGMKYGIPFLFLYPEIQDSVGFLSHLILGLGCGGFILAFNISSYVLNGFRFPFIATLGRPFIKYSINNFIVPALFVAVFIYQLVDFQLHVEIEAPSDVFIHVLGFLLGIVIFLLIGFTYFFGTNKNIFKVLAKDKVRNKKNGVKTSAKRKTGVRPTKGILHKKKTENNFFTRDRYWKVETYMSSFLKIGLARESEHYAPETLRRVFAQNHINASLFEILCIGTVIFLGWFIDSPDIALPSGASLFLLFTMGLMFFSALHSWFKGWTYFIILALFFGYNLMARFDLTYTNTLYGLNYNDEKADYSLKNLHHLSDNPDTLQNDIKNYVNILNKWRLKNSTNSNKRKKRPKLVIVATSGGGHRSALWTVHSLLHADSVLEGQLLPHIQLITGSSGGMIGAAYLRELYKYKQIDPSYDLYNPDSTENIARDMLNPIVYAIAVNDMFIRPRSFEYNDMQYTIDRGYAFEKQLNNITGGSMNKKLMDYYEDEKNAVIPTMVFNPTIINDGRRLLISAQNVSFLASSSTNTNVSNLNLIESVEFRRLFKNQNADDVLFTSVLRASATFPYILPNPKLPSEPVIQLMDAGVRDNFGLRNAIKFMYTFRNWISTNTDGVVIIQIRDKFKEQEVKDYSTQSKLESFLNPVGSFYANWFQIQDFDHDDLLKYAGAWFDNKLDVIQFQLKNEEEDHISLSWHLTTLEKHKILHAIHIKDNEEAVQKLKTLLVD